MTDADEARQMVILPSGKVVPAIRTELDPHAYTPAHLLEWIERYGHNLPEGVREFKRKICTDRRMAEFWDWLGSVRFNRLDNLRSSISVSDELYRATKLPGKPGNMTPSQREAYFKRVRAHARALQVLLEGTLFDYPHLSEVQDDELDKPLRKALYGYGADEAEEGHTVAFQITPKGRFRHHYNYPDNVFTEILSGVIEWTYWDDNWDGGWQGSSAPIAQANSASTPIIYFCCTLHDWFRGKGVSIPFPLLATLANVALDIPAQEQVDEETVRKQVRRYQQRIAKVRAERPNAFDGAPGQNLQEWDDSVLSDPF